MIHGLNIWKTLNLYGDLKNDLHHIIIMRDISWVLPTSCNSNHDLNHIFLPRRRAPKKNAISGASTLIIIFDLGNARKTSEHKRRNTYWHSDAVWVPQLQVLTHPRAQADQWASMPVATPGNGPDRNAGSMKTDRRKHSFPSGESRRGPPGVTRASSPASKACREMCKMCEGIRFPCPALVSSQNSCAWSPSESMQRRGPIARNCDTTRLSA